MMAGIIIVLAWLTTAALVCLLYFTVWRRHAAYADNSHRDDSTRPPRG